MLKNFALLLLAMTCSLGFTPSSSANKDLPKEGFVEVRGGRVWYKIEGRNKPGIPLLVLHGGPGAPHFYLEPLAELSNERPVIFYDQLGCGNSDRPQDPSLWKLERFVEELGQVRAALGLKQVHILGQSWGTMLAVEYLLTKHPKGVKSLVLSGPALSAPRFEADQRSYLAELPKKDREAIEKCEASGHFEAPEYQEAMNAFYHRHVCRLDPWPDDMNKTFEKMGVPVYEKMWGPSEFTVSGNLKGFDRTARLKEIKIPALFVCGRYDEATPETTAYYHQMMPGSEMAVIENASHQAHLEQPEEYLALLRDFLRRSEKK